MINNTLGYIGTRRNTVISNFRNAAILTADKKSAKTVKKAVSLPVALKKDTVTLSPQALSRSNQLSAFSAITSVNGKSVKDLKAVNNVLTLNAGEYFRVKLDNGLNMIVSSGSERSIFSPIEDLQKELGLGIDGDYYAPETARAYNKMNRFLMALNDFSTYGLHSQFTQEELLDYFGRIGIKPGGWVEINNRGRVNRFYLEENGICWPEEQSENARQCFSEWIDWRTQGCTTESVLIVNGKEYKMDENGHFNIPKGEPVIYNSGMVVFPKEIREFLLTQTAAALGHDKE